MSKYEFNNKLVKYGGLASASLMTFSAHAGIVYTDVDPDSTITTIVQEQLPIDFNNDGQLDLLIIGNDFTSNYWAIAAVGIPNSGYYANTSLFNANNAVVGYYNGNSWSVGSALLCGNAIGPAQNFVSNSVWSNKNYACLGSWDSSAGSFYYPFVASYGEKYVGCKFDIGGSIHYGWIRLNTTTLTGNNIEIDVMDYAYQSYPNMGITAGEAGGVCQACNLNTSVSKVSDTLVAAADSIFYQWLNCDSNYAPVSGAVNQSYIGAGGGRYAAELTNGACKDTSACYFIPISGMKDKLLSGIHYNNPVQNELIITFEAHQKNMTIDILDINGHLLKSEKIQNANQHTSELTYQSGIYVVRLRSEEGKETSFKVVKE